jgi:hypothetical protein
MSMRRHSTAQVARKLEIDQGNFQRLIRKRAIPFPPLTQVGGLRIRLWSDRDVARARKALAERRRSRRTKND